MWDGGPPTRDQPAQGLPAASGRQGSPRLTLGPVLLPSEQGLAPTMLLPISLYHVVPPGGPKLRPALVPGGREGVSLPFILSPLLQSEGPGSTPLGKPSTPMLTVNLVSALPLLSPGPSPSLGSPSKVRSTGRYLCPHCGRDCLKPSVLEKHIRSHTGERPFPCDTCGIAFKTQSNLYKHRRTQTHLNNSRRSSESDGGGSHLLDEVDRAGEPPGLDNSGASRSQRGDEGPSESLDAKPEAAACGGLSLADGETPPDTNGMQSRQKSPAARKLCPLQRQQATSWEKAWDAKGSSEGRLRKCESSDSGYLSRSDSSEQPPVPASPLRSLSERSADGEGGPGPGERPETQELEKRWLEERIARLISHNQAVVDDPQLDTVRPRKTVLSKQGSIDLPMPYTYKDSFHFDMRALEPGRRRQATMGWAGSTRSPPDKTRPLSFHSVSTQFRTTMECVSVTRSNSLPFVESARTWQEWEPDAQETCPRRQRPLSPRPVPAQLGSSWPAMPSSHPRALVRQAAVEDLVGTPSGESLVLAEDPPKTTAIEGTVSRGRGSRKRGDQRRLKMFSQEKWRVYRDETFKRIYQKDQKAAEMRVAASPQTEAKRAGATRTSVSGDVKTPVCGEEKTPVFGDILPPATMSSESESGSRGGDQAAPEFSLVAESPKSKSECSDEQEGKRAVKPPNCSCRDAPSLDLKTPQVPPNGRVEPGGELSLGSEPLNGRDPGCSDGGEKGAHLWNTPRLAIAGPGQARATGNRLPSERKKLKVDRLGGQGRLKRPGAGGDREETPEDPVQASSPPAGDSDLVERLGDSMDRGNHTGTSSAVSSAVLRQAGPRGKEPPLHPAAVPPGPHSQVPDHTFTPKYLLRLPQGETSSEPQASKGCEQGRGPLCWRRWPEKQVSSMGSGRGMPLCPGPASVRVSGETDIIPEVRDGVEGTQAREEDEDSLHTSPPRSRHPAVLTSTSTLGSCLARNTEVETPTVHPLCLGSTSRPPGVAPNPWPPVWEKVLEASSSRPLNRLSASCPFQSGPFFSAITQPPAWPKLALPLHSGNPRSLGTKGAFPSLGTEPRLTWCCLSRSLPLPAEQKETSSVYSSLHLVRSSPQDEGPEGQTVISRGDPPSVPTSKPSCPVAPETTSQDWVPEQKRRPPRRRAKMARGSSRQKKLRINSERHKGVFRQSHVQLRASRRRKPHWVLRGSCHPPSREGRDPCKPLRRPSSETAGLTPQGEPSRATSEPSLCCGNKEKKEHGCRRVSDISPPAGEPGNCFTQSTAVVLDSCLALTKEHLPPCDKGLAIGLFETQPLLPTAHVSVDPKPGIFTDTQEPSSFEFKGTFSGHDDSTSVAILCTPLEKRVGDTMMTTPSSQPQGHSWTPQETLAPSPPDKKATAKGKSPSPLPEKHSSVQRISGVLPLELTEKIHLEKPASGWSSGNSHQEEERHNVFFPSKGHYEHGEKVTPCHPLENSSDKCQVPGSVTLKNCMVPSSPGQPTDIPEAPSKTTKKRSLEGMRKQTRVEFSDSSSDDEHRLVIEI